jgi:hypothetical protein
MTDESAVIPAKAGIQCFHPVQARRRTPWIPAFAEMTKRGSGNDGHLAQNPPMPLVATSSRRQIAMAVMLALAIAGGVIRHEAPNPSTLRDIGSLLLVMWLPAVGNFVGFLMRKIPRSAPPPTHFDPAAPFTAQLRVQLEPVPLPDGFIAALDPVDDRGTLLSGRRGFTIRLDRPLAQWLAAPGDQPVAMECLLPKVALRALVPGTPVHLLVGTTAVARGQVLAA